MLIIPSVSLYAGSMCPISYSFMISSNSALLRLTTINRLMMFGQSSVRQDSMSFATRSAALLLCWFSCITAMLLKPDVQSSFVSIFRIVLKAIIVELITVSRIMPEIIAVRIFRRLTEDSVDDSSPLVGLLLSEIG